MDPFVTLLLSAGNGTKRTVSPHWQRIVCQCCIARSTRIVIVVVLTVPLAIRVRDRTPSAAEFIAQVDVVVVGKGTMVKLSGMIRHRDVQYLTRPTGDAASRGGIKKEVGWDVSNAREGAGGGLKSGCVHRGVGMLEGVFSRIFELIGLKNFPRVMLKEDGWAEVPREGPPEMFP